MPNSQIKQIFEFCKNGNTKQLLDALNDSNESLVLDDRQNSVLSMALKSSQWPTAEALIQNNFIYFHSNQPGLISASQCKNDDDTGIRLVLKLTDNIN